MTTCCMVYEPSLGLPGITEVEVDVVVVEEEIVDRGRAEMVFFKGCIYFHEL